MKYVVQAKWDSEEITAIMQEVRKYVTPLEYRTFQRQIDSKKSGQPFLIDFRPKNQQKPQN